MCMPKHITFYITLIMCLSCFFTNGQQKKEGKANHISKVKHNSNIISHNHWIEDRFYKNLNIDLNPWYYDNVPELVFQPLELHTTMDNDPEKNSSFYFSGGEQTY